MTDSKQTLRQRFACELAALNNIVHRCSNPAFKQWKDYGGRGITVHASWTGPGGFEQFLKDVGPKPSPEKVISRKNMDGNYEPGNVIWDDRRTAQLRRRRGPDGVNRVTGSPSATNTSGKAGVKWVKDAHRWRASMVYKGKSYYFGDFENKEDAIAARVAAELRVTAGLSPARP